MKRQELISKYLEFFMLHKKFPHKKIPNYSLIPENDPTALFTSAGMHPLVPYLLGQKHPLGKRIVNMQKCIRTTDIDEVGDKTHHTFFEMLGNWSLGDYWKEEAIKMSFEFLTKILKIPKQKIAVSIFKGNKNTPKDEESAKIWESLGILKERIAFLPESENWWGPTGKTGPCGPDTEIFYWSSEKLKSPKDFNPKNDNWVEIWNNVLMQYHKDKRLILVDGMHCLYDKTFSPNQELLNLINNFNTHTILVVNKFRNNGIGLIKNYDKTRDTNWKAFSLEEKGIEKTNPEYFKALIKKFNLAPEEMLYFDHSKENVETAKKMGILSKQYINTKSVKKFIEANLYTYIPAKQKNIDTGMGLERVIAVLNNLEDNYLTELFFPIIKNIEKISKKEYGKNKNETRIMRIIADHIKASVFIISENITPSNTEQGYVLRMLIRRAVRYGKIINIKNFLGYVAEPIFEIYKDYDSLQKNKKSILKILEGEEEKFNQTLEKGLNKFKKIAGQKKEINGKNAFLLFQSYGFPFEITEELAKENKIKVDRKGFLKEFEKHKKLSQTAIKGRFKSGLADDSLSTTKLHTIAHLLLSALREILKENTIIQKGSNITPERLRLDFSFQRKLTEEEIKQVENLVNEKIEENCPVILEQMTPGQAKEQGALGIFDEKYGNKVSVYTIKSKGNSFSKEICAGPHVKNTKELREGNKKFKIKKQKSVGEGARRIRAVLE